MSKLNTELLQPGMVVTADVTNMDGMLLVPAGCAITERHVSILQAWGITEVLIEDGSAEESKDILEQLPPEVVQRMTDDLRNSFWEPIEKNPIQAEVFQLVLRRRAREQVARQV